MYGLPDDFTSWYYNWEPSAGYSHWMRSLGLGPGAGGNQNYRNYVYGQYNRYKTDYEALAGQDSTLSWMTYLSRQNPQQEFMSLSPEQRGERPGLYTPRMRWVAF